MTEITDKLSTALADRYQIERQLGEGGMATVYLATDLKHDRKVAVKVLRPELAAVLGADQFAKRQDTWLRRMERQGVEIRWLEGRDSPEANAEKVLDHVRRLV